MRLRGSVCGSGANVTFGDIDERVGKAEGGAEFERRMLGHGLGVLLEAAEAVVEEVVEEVVREGTDWEVLLVLVLELELGASALREEEALDSSEPEERAVSPNAAWTIASNWAESGTFSDTGSAALCGPTAGNVCGSDMDGALGVAVEYKGCARALTNEASTRVGFSWTGQVRPGREKRAKCLGQRR